MSKNNKQTHAYILFTQAVDLHNRLITRRKSAGFYESLRLRRMIEDAKARAKRRMKAWRNFSKLAE